MGVEEGSGVIGEIYIGRVLVTASSVCVGYGRGVPSVNARVGVG
jgi:hypothetical protein